MNLEMLNRGTQRDTPLWQSTNMADLTNHVAVITGASGALGEWVTKAFLAAGAQVLAMGHGKGMIEADLSDANSAQAAMKQAQAAHGRIDSLIHLVGGFAGGADLANENPSTFDAMFNTNVRTTFNVIRAVTPIMRAASHGSIVLTASRSAVEPSPNAALYGAAKAAVVSLARSAAAENAKFSITVNAVMPGTMDTRANRAAMPTADYSTWVDPQQVAQLMTFLASPAARSINGAAIPILGKQS